MLYTDNLALRLPEETDYYNVDDFNQNAIVIDSEIQDIKDQIDAMQLNFQNGVESTYEACVSKGATPTQHTLTNIATALRNMFLVITLPLIQAHNCGIDGQGIVRRTALNNNTLDSSEILYTDVYGFEPSSDNTKGYSYTDGAYFLPCETVDNMLSPLSHNFPNYKISVRFSYKKGETGIIDFFTNSPYREDISSTGYFTSSYYDIIYPRIFIFKDKANNYKLCVNGSFYKYMYDSEEEDTCLFRAFLNHYGDTYYDSIVLDTCLSSNNVNKWYTVSIELNSKIVICLYDESEELLERKVWNPVWTNREDEHTSDAIEELNSAIPNFKPMNVSFDLNNSYITMDSNMVWGKDTDDMESKYPYARSQTEYQSPEVSTFHDPYERTDWRTSLITDIQSLIYSFELGRTIGQSLDYYWGESSVRLDQLLKYNLDGTNVYGSWMVSDVISPYINNLGIQVVLCNPEYFTLSDGVTKCNYVVFFSIRTEILAKIEETASIDYVYTWENSNRRNWCNTCFREIAENTFGMIFKSFRCPTERDYDDSTINYTDDYFALASVTECQTLDAVPLLYDRRSILRTPGTNQNQVKYYNNGTISDIAVDSQDRMSYIVGCI